MSSFDMDGPCYGFENFEEKFQEKYDKLKLPFTPCVVVSVQLLSFRGVSNGKLFDWIDKPDPEFIVTCPKVKRLHLKQFKTRNIGDDVTKGFIGQTFKFVVPKDLSSEDKFPIEIELIDRDLICNDNLGKETIEASFLPTDGTVFSYTLKFGTNNGELDVKINKSLVTSPDFRYSLGLCPEEKAFRKKRIPLVQKAMKNLLGNRGPNTPEETPIVSLCGSGGGYRAVIGMCGAMEALRDAGLLDVFTYNCGLSGSSWYFTAGYTLQAMKGPEQQTFHDELRKRFCSNLMWDMINPFTITKYQDYLDETRKKYGQPYTFVNYFPGYLVGKQMLADKMTKTLSDLVPYVETAEVPYPILVALHVKNRLKAGAYHAYVERTPYEISLPSYGIHLKPKQEGSTWNAGVLVREFPQYPVHFTIAMTGCAFSILLNSYLSTGGELKKDFLELMETERVNGKKNANKDLVETNRYAEIESDDDDNDDDDNAVIPDWTTQPKNSALSAAAFSAFSVAASPGAPEKMRNQVPLIREMIRNSTFFTTRNGVVGRTARLFNFALGLEKVERHLLNPFGCDHVNHNRVAKSIVEKLGVLDFDQTLSTQKNVLCFADAGVLKNVPTDVLLRPQRNVNVIIVLDFNAYESDHKFNYQPLIAAATQAWQSGLEFPTIDFEKISNMPPTEFLLLPSDGPNCPTVLWFTLCNKKFREEKNYVPRSTTRKSNDKDKSFNDFTVFGDGSNYSTFTFHYDEYHFDQLRELMYYNIISHKKDIEDALAKATSQKQAKVHGK